MFFGSIANSFYHFFSKMKSDCGVFLILGIFFSTVQLWERLE